MIDRKSDVSNTRRRARKGQRRSVPGALSQRVQDSVHNAIEDTFRILREQPSTEANPRLALLVDAVDTKYEGSDFLRTRSAFVSPKERASLAIAKWLTTEYRNEKTNSRVLFSIAHFNMGGREVSSQEVLLTARRFILETIGSQPPLIKQGLFTNGASTRIKRDGYAAAAKFQGSPHSTISAWKPFLETLDRGDLFRWAEWNEQLSSPTYVDGSEMFTVPKNARIDRVACKEPEANMYLQRAYGDFIRNKLRKRGINLNDQSQNQKLAQHGSRWAFDRDKASNNPENLVTIDLSSASDSISCHLVRLLLTKEWFEALDAVRVQKTLIPNHGWHELKMFSSMGNGFTFELESLIFWALTRSVAYHARRKGRISVYGDDIICPIAVGRILKKVLPWFGFALNIAKSCFGPELRESCGAWWLSGHDATPFYYRSKVKHVTDVIQLGNQLMKWLVTRHYREGTDRSLVELWLQLKKAVPEHLWGGMSFTRVDALVTGDAPRSVIQRVLSKRQKAQIRSKAPELGAYIKWHHDASGIYLNPLWVPFAFTARELSRSQVYTSPTEPTLSDKVGIWVVRPNTSEHSGRFLRLVRSALECSGKLLHNSLQDERRFTRNGRSLFVTVLGENGNEDTVYMWVGEELHA